MPNCRVENRLAEQSVRIGHDGSDHVDQLREARQYDAVKRGGSANSKSRRPGVVLQVVDFFQQVRRFLTTAFIHGVTAGGPSTSHHRTTARVFSETAFSADHVANCQSHSNLADPCSDSSQRISCLSFPSPVECSPIIAMGRESIDVVVALLEDLAVPLQVGRHDPARWSRRQSRTRAIDRRIASAAPRPELSAVFGGGHADRSARDRPFRSPGTSGFTL